jgi:IS5 family transposase
MLRIYFLQQWLSLSDPQAEEALYDCVSMHIFVAIDYYITLIHWLYQKKMPPPLWLP